MSDDILISELADLYFRSPHSGNDQWHVICQLESFISDTDQSVLQLKSNGLSALTCRITHQRYDWSLAGDGDAEVCSSVINHNDSR